MGPDRWDSGPGGALGSGAAQLNLTDEQKQAIRTICQQSRADANEVVAAIDDARAALHEAVIAGADEAKIRAAAAALGTAIGNQAVLQAQTIAAAKAVLTEEQRKEYEKIRASVPHSRAGHGRSRVRRRPLRDCSLTGPTGSMRRASLRSTASPRTVLHPCRTWASSRCSSG